MSACTTGQANTTPPISSGGGGGGGSQSAVLQLAMGTANFEGATGLVLLETFRGANGYTAIPISSARLTGPSGFLAPKHSKDPGSGASRSIPIGSASNQFVIGTGISPMQTPLAGADGWGIGPPSCSCPGINFYPFQPQFADVAANGVFVQAEPIYGGPPAYPPTTLAASALSQLISIPSSWSEGFYLIGLTSPPPSGSYSVRVSYTQNGVLHSRSAGAALRASRVLPKFDAGEPSLQSDHRGGLIVTLRVPHGVRQVLVNVIDPNVPPSTFGKPCKTGLGFATLVFTKSGAQRIPDNLGNYGQGGAPTFCKGDIVEAQAFGFDYDDFDLGPPHNTQQRPALPAQADMTIGYPALGLE